MPENTRMAIQDAYLRLYRQYGAEQVSVTRLCREAHVSRTTFYAYYDSADAVLREIEDRLITDLFTINEDFKNTDFSGYRRGQSFPYFDETLSYIQTHLPCFQALLNRSEPRFIYKWKGIIKHHFAEKYQQECVDLPHPDLVLEIIAVSVIAAYGYWARHPDEISAETVAREALSRLVLDLIP